MDKIPLCWCGKNRGELTTEQEALYLRFSARCRLPEPGLWCVWAVGEQGELRLGILEPCGDEAYLCRRFSSRMTAPLGRLLRGELRPVVPVDREEWSPLRVSLLETPWLRQQLQRVKGVLFRTKDGVRYLAVPYVPQQPFPLVSLFCFANVQTINGRPYAVFAFDREEQPVFGKEKSVKK